VLEVIPTKNHACYVVEGVVATTRFDLSDLMNAHVSYEANAVTLPEVLRTPASIILAQ